MADKENSIRKAVSLNDSHYRFIQDLSAPPPKPKEESEQVPRRLCKQSHTDDSIPHFSGITDFDSPLEEEEAKPVKVKMEGRRRLCKISSRNAGDADKPLISNKPNFSGICDFGSPLQTKNVCEDGGQIRDILNDMISKLDTLSIKKKAAPKTDFPEYASADSSFSRTSGPSDSSSGWNKNVGGGVQDVIDLCEHEVCEKDSRKVNEKLVSVSARQFFDSNVEKEKKSEWKRHLRNGTTVSTVHEPKKNFRRLKKNEPKNAYDRLLSVGGSFASKHGEEDGDYCVLLSNKQGFKKAVGYGDNLKKYDQSEEVDELDGYDDGSLSESDQPVILSGSNSTFKLPTTVAKMLYPHQREGLKWLWSLHCQGKGGILGDDMGLGKTMQICGFLAGLFHSKLIKRALIVAPKTLLSHWIKELSVVGLSRKTREYFATSVKTRQYELEDVLQNQGILLTTYDIVRNNSKALKGESYYSDNEDDIIWDYMILDEGHLIKNPSTQRAKSLLDIPSAHRIIISGTPIQNNLKELWALFNFCCPELLGDNKWFKERYEHAILRGNDKNATEREKRIGSTVAKELRERIKPYFLRRLKKEVFYDDDATTAKLSKKNEIIVWLKLTGCQQRLYEAFLNSEIVLSAFDGSPLAALTILKKICDHPLLLTKRAAEDVLEGMESMLNPEDVSVAEKLAMHVADVAETNDFQDNHDNLSCKISFILSLLDTLIPEGHHVLIFSQTRKMLNLIQIYKGGLFKTATEHKEQIRYFSQQDLRELFSIPKQGFDISLTQKQLHEEHDSQHKMY